MSHRRTTILVCAAALLLPIATMPAHSAAASTPSQTKVEECDLQSWVRPRSFALHCASPGHRLSDLTWTSWGGRQASATGILRIRLCHRSCVDADEVFVPVDVVLSRRQRGYYTRLTVKPRTLARFPVAEHPDRRAVWDLTPRPHRQVGGPTRRS